MSKPLGLLVVLMIAALVAGCGDEGSGSGDGGNGSGSAADSPTAALKAMLALAESGKWDEYVSTYYGEKHKMDNPTVQIAQVAGRIAKSGPKLIEMLKACVEHEPTLSEDGTKATFPNGITLYKDDGKWGFHL